MAKEKKAKVDWSDNKEKAISQAQEYLNRQFGDGTMMIGQCIVNVPAIPTGALNLDLALGVGGIPRGRVTEIYGPEGSGKTTLMLHVLANVQKDGGVAAFIDAEHALDKEYAENIGINFDKLIINQPDCGEQALDVVEVLCESGAVDAIVIDSVAALVPRAELDGNIGDHHIGTQARMMSQAMRKLCSKARKSNTAIIFINQLREKIGVMFGNPETTTGGRALKFYSSVRLDIRRIATIKKDGGAFGSQVRVKVVKNKVAPPLKQAEFEIIFGKGINQAACILDLATEYGFIAKKGNFYRIGDTVIGNGKSQASEWLEANEAKLRELEIEIIDKLSANKQAIKINVPENDDSGFDGEDT